MASRRVAAGQAAIPSVSGLSYELRAGAGKLWSGIGAYEGGTPGVTRCEQSPNKPGI